MYRAHTHARASRNIYMLAPHITFKVSRGGEIITYYKGEIAHNDAPRAYTTIPARAIGFNPTKKDMEINIEKIAARDGGKMLYALAARAAFMTMRAAFTAKNGAILKGCERAADKAAALERAADKGGSSQYEVKCWYCNSEDKKERGWYYSTNTLKSEIFNSLANAAAAGLMEKRTMRGALNAATSENLHCYGKAVKVYKAINELITATLDKTEHYKSESRARSIIIDTAAALTAQGVDSKIKQVYALTASGYLTSEIAAIVYGARVNADNAKYWCDRVNNKRREANRLISAAIEHNVNVNKVRARHIPNKKDIATARAFTARVHAAAADKERAAVACDNVVCKSKSKSERESARAAAAATQSNYFDTIAAATYRTRASRRGAYKKSNAAAANK